MHALKQALSPILCCFGIRSSERSPPSDLSNLQHPASALSIQLPASTVPHAVSQSPSQVADTDALRQIFRSSSSVRGYRTASQSSALPARRQPSLDVDFKFGHAAKERKQPGRLEQLGSHIKQKLSESRLSKSSSRQQNSGEVACDSTGTSLQRLGVENPEAALSQRSTGLLELLMSRAGSEGGYDSDAKSIQTAMLKETNGTGKTNPQAQADISGNCIANPPTNDDPLTAQGLDTSVFQQVETGVSSTSTPAKTSFLKVVLQESDRSPTQVLQDLSDGLLKGTIELPVLAGLTADYRISTGKDEAASLDSTGRNYDPEFERALRRLSATVATAKSESLASDAENGQESLLSNLDPRLIAFISNFDEHSSTGCSGRPSHEDVFHEMETLKSVERGERSSLQRSPGDSGGLSRDMKSITDSERSSIHLYNMRISQQLASPSITGPGSRPETSRTSIDQAKNEAIDAWPTLSQLSLAERHPSWIATEHNRRPSDPQTRRLFENIVPSGRSRSQLSKTAPVRTALNSSQAQGPVSKHDDVSSSYGSDGDRGSAEHGIARKRRRNPNSIAIAGRSESVSLPIGSSRGSMSHVSVAEESAWFGRRSSQMRRKGEEDGQVGSPSQRQRSASMPTGNRSGLLAVGTARGMRKRGTTEECETLSEISSEQIQDARRERLTEISVEAVHDAYNERMSDVDAGMIPARRGMIDTTELGHTSWTSQRLSDTSSERREAASGHRTDQSRGFENSLHETTTDMWRRTLRRAIEESQDESLGGFLTAPKFDRNGRRRSSTSGHSASKSDKEVVAGEACSVSGSRSLENVLVDTTMVEGRRNTRSSSLRSEAPSKLELRRSVPMLKLAAQPATTITGRKAPKKKSILDLGRRFTINGGSGEEDRHQGSSITFRDLLGLWGRFPSHSREVRCGPAGAKDGVAVRDFALECTDENATCHPALQPSWDRSTLTLGLHTPPSWRRLPFGRKARFEKGKSRSLDILRNSVNESRTSVVRVRKNGRGLAWRWKKIYRSSSSDLRAYVQTYGHRSSISMSASVEYPELEIIPGHDGSHDPRPKEQGVGRSGSTDNVTGQSHEVGPAEAALPWTAMYRNCVGSLSALKSDLNLRPVSQVDDSQQRHSKDAGDMVSSDVRSSTADFEMQLWREHEAVKEGLIKKIENMGKDELGAEVKQKQVKQD